ncbi:unnamed protein product [Urochloa humidicola]
MSSYASKFMPVFWWSSNGAVPSVEVGGGRGSELAKGSGSRSHDRGPPRGRPPKLPDPAAADPKVEGPAPGRERRPAEEEGGGVEEEEEERLRRWGGLGVGDVGPGRAGGRHGGGGGGSARRRRTREEADLV